MRLTLREVAGFPALTNCQSTPDHRDEIEQACDMALETLSLDDAAPT